MSNPYGWSPPMNGQPPVYFAPPGQAVNVTSYSAPASGDVPYDTGYGQYQSFRDQYHHQPQQDPFAWASKDTSPFSLAARGARASVSFVDALILWLKNWRNFSGRASRSEYWNVQVAQAIVRILAIVLLFGLIQMSQLTPGDALISAGILGVAIVAVVVMLLTAIPNLSLMVRRLHDTDHSGWYYFVAFLPFGSWFVLYQLARRSDPAGWRFDDYLQPLYGPEDLTD